MKEIILSLVTDIDTAWDFYSSPYSSKEYYKDSTWCRYTFICPRSELREKIQSVIDIVSKYEVGYDVSTSWQWKDHEYNGYYFRNDFVTYKLFITGHQKCDISVLDYISDTTDPLYECGLFNLKDSMIKDESLPAEIKESLEYINNYSRTSYGFNIGFYTKKSAKAFYETNPFKKYLEIEEATSYENKKMYICKMYMDDKIPEVMMPYNFSTAKKRVKKATTKKLNKSTQDLIKSALDKLTDEEKEALGVLYYSEF